MKTAIRIGLFLLLLTARIFADGARESDGIARFTPPPEWKRQTHRTQVSFLSPDGEGAFAISASARCESLDKNADAILATVSGSPQFRIESPRSKGKHNVTGGQWLTFTYSCADASRPGELSYVLVTLVGAGGRSVAVIGAFADAPTFNRHIKSMGHMVDSMQLTSALVIEKGSPPLTQFSVDATDEFLEWLIQTPLNDGQKQAVETELRGSWQRNDREQLDGIKRILDMRDEIAALTPDKRELAREGILNPALRQWRFDPSPGAKMMLEIYDCSHRSIAAGNPPLTQQSVDALVELLCFVAGQTAGVTSPPSVDLRAKIADQVSASYPSLTPEQQKRIASAPLAWAALRAAWPGYSDAQRQHGVDTWRRDDAIVKLGTTLPGVVPAPADSPRGSNQDTLAKRQAAQKQQLIYQEMSNCIQLQNDASRAIIHVGKGSHYEYRWR